MIEVLRKIFEANPEKSAIIVNGKCSDCGCKVSVEIKLTSGGFGLLGGAVMKYSPNRYLTKCTDCCELNPKAEDRHKSKLASTQ